MYKPGHTHCIAVRPAHPTPTPLLSQTKHHSTTQHSPAALVHGVWTVCFGGVVQNWVRCDHTPKRIDWKIQFCEE
ncbi:MAG: hypothetical protein GY938_22655 [Ketobacter sp.]|nr:hypothetical protein [Ketobacter sp.]